MRLKRWKKIPYIPQGYGLGQLTVHRPRTGARLAGDIIIYVLRLPITKNLDLFLQILLTSIYKCATIQSSRERPPKPKGDTTMKRSTVKYPVTIYSPRNSVYIEYADTLEEARKIATSYPANLWPVLIRKETRSIAAPVEKYERGTLVKTFDQLF